MLAFLSGSCNAHSPDLKPGILPLAPFMFAVLLCRTSSTTAGLDTSTCDCVVVEAHKIHFPYEYHYWPVAFTDSVQVDRIQLTATE